MSFVIVGLRLHQDDVERRKECAGDLHAPGHDRHRNPQRLDPLDPTVLGAHLGTVDDRVIPRNFLRNHNVIEKITCKPLVLSSSQLYGKRSTMA